MNIELSGTDLAFVAAALNDRIAELDGQLAHIASERDRLGFPESEDEDTIRLVRSAYARIVRKVEQALDVPFLDQDDAMALLVHTGTVVVSAAR